MSPSLTGPLTFLMMQRVLSSRNSTLTCGEIKLAKINKNDRTQDMPNGGRHNYTIKEEKGEFLGCEHLPGCTVPEIRSFLGFWSP